MCAFHHVINSLSPTSPLFTRGLPRTSWAAAVASVVTGDLAATETP